MSELSPRRSVTSHAPVDCSATPALAGIDGCHDGWVVVSEIRGALSAWIATTIAELDARLPAPARVAIDIPIGLPQQQRRSCEVLARRLLGAPRSTSVFPVPARPCLAATSHSDASRINHALTGRRLSIQSWAIMPKIREVDAYVRHADRAHDLTEIHPEVSFAAWNGLKAMRHSKHSREGRLERAQLIDTLWPGGPDRLWAALDGRAQRDDLYDAFAALWTARRLARDTAVSLPAQPEHDSMGLSMCISY